MNISIVIPNYNGDHLLKKNLGAVLKSFEFYLKEEAGGGEIIIVDDASTDNSLLEINNEKLKNKNENIKIKFIQNKKNLGFSSTVNKGVAHAEGEIAVLLNTDVCPEKDFLYPLLKHFNDPSIFGVGCMDKSIEDGRVVLRGRGVGKWKRGFLVHSAGEIGNRTSTLWASGGSSAFRLSLWKKLGGLDKLFDPFYWEDIDLSYRAKKAGYKIIFEKESVVIHDHEKGTIQTKYSKRDIKTIAYRNQFIFVWKNISDWNLLISHLLWLPFHMVNLGWKGDIAFFIGFIKAITRLPDILKSRSIMKNYFKKSDEEIISETHY